MTSARITYCEAQSVLKFYTSQKFYTSPKQISGYAPAGGQPCWNLNSPINLAYDRQQLSWQKQVTFIGSIDLVSRIDKYQTGVAQFRHFVAAID